MTPSIGPGAMPYTIDPNSAYAKTALSDAQARVALAGARLANVLHKALAQ